MITNQKLVHRILACVLLSQFCFSQETARMTYEQPPILKASQILEPSLLKSPYHEVAEEISTYGYANAYVLKSKFGTVHVRGTAMLRVRVQEIKAIEEIETIKATQEFGDAVARAAKSPLLATKHLISNPVETVSGVPRGAFRVLGRAYEGLRGKKKKGEFLSFLR